MKSVSENLSICNLGNTSFKDGPLAKIATLPEYLRLNELCNLLLKIISTKNAAKLMESRPIDKHCFIILFIFYRFQFFANTVVGYLGSSPVRCPVVYGYVGLKGCV